MTCLVVVPVLRRPHRVAPLLDSLNGSTDQPFRVLFVAAPRDTAVIDAVESAGADLRVVDWEPGTGDYARKVNLAVCESADPLIFLGADDLRFHPGWLEAATAQLAPGVGVVGTNDLGNPRVIRGEHATHCLVTRDYAKLGQVDGTPGLLHEGYMHEFCDDELVGTAKHRGAWAFAKDSHVEHLHPHWGKAPTDPLYDAQRHRMAASVGLYRRRRRLWT